MKKIIKIISWVFLSYTLLTAVYSVLSPEIQAKIPLDQLTTYVSGIITLLGGGGGLALIGLINRFENTNDDKVNELIAIITAFSNKLEHNTKEQLKTQEANDKTQNMIRVDLSIKRDSKLMAEKNKQLIDKVLGNEKE